MWGWLRRRSRAIPDALWQRTLDRYPFLAKLSKAEREHLRRLCGRFLAQKEFTGTERLHISDEIALAIAAQACLPVLHLDQHGRALHWYRDFVGIVVHRREVVAQREITDHAGVVHRYREVLAGEAMHKGPVMLNWRDVAHAGVSAGQGYNVVIHEFVHKMDMQSGRADGCPPLPPGFGGTRSPTAARRLWLATLQPAYDGFREQVIVAERFGGEPPWLNAYGATSLAEFFAVTCEAYFVNRGRFELELPALVPLYDEFFNRTGALPP